MNFNCFWSCLEKGSKSPKDYKYKVEDDNLIIDAPQNQSSPYNTTNETAKQYYDLLFNK